MKEIREPRPKGESERIELRIKEKGYIKTKDLIRLRRDIIEEEGSLKGKLGKISIIKILFELYPIKYNQSPSQRVVGMEIGKKIKESSLYSKEQIMVEIKPTHQASGWKDLEIENIRRMLILICSTYPFLKIKEKISSKSKKSRIITPKDNLLTYEKEEKKYLRYVKEDLGSRGGKIEILINRTEKIKRKEIKEIERDINTKYGILKGELKRLVKITPLFELLESELVASRCSTKTFERNEKLYRLEEKESLLEELYLETIKIGESIGKEDLRRKLRRKVIRLVKKLIEKHKYLKYNLLE